MGGENLSMPSLPSAAGGGARATERLREEKERKRTRPEGLRNEKNAAALEPFRAAPGISERVEGGRKTNSMSKVGPANLPLAVPNGSPPRDLPS